MIVKLGLVSRKENNILITIKITQFLLTVNTCIRIVVVKVKYSHAINDTCVAWPNLQSLTTSEFL